MLRLGLPSQHGHSLDILMERYGLAKPREPVCAAFAAGGQGIGHFHRHLSAGEAAPVGGYPRPPAIMPVATWISSRSADRPYRPGRAEVVPFRRRRGQLCRPFRARPVRTVPHRTIRMRLSVIAQPPERKNLELELLNGPLCESFNRVQEISSFFSPVI